MSDLLLCTKKRKMMYAKSIFWKNECIYINDQLPLTLLKRWTSCLNCTAYHQWKKNRGKKAKVYFGSLCVYLSIISVSFFLSFSRDTDRKEDREVQAKKNNTQHSTLTHFLPWRHQNRLMNIRIYLFLAYVIRLRKTITTLHLFILHDDFFPSWSYKWRLTWRLLLIPCPHIWRERMKQSITIDGNSNDYSHSVHAGMHPWWVSSNNIDVKNTRIKKRTTYARHQWNDAVISPFFIIFYHVITKYWGKSDEKNVDLIWKIETLTYGWANLWICKHAFPPGNQWL
jgi:hypothetical protein